VSVERKIAAIFRPERPCPKITASNAISEDEAGDDLHNAWRAHAVDSAKPVLAVHQVAGGIEGR
jgi:hypothetical protein